MLLFQQMFHLFSNIIITCNTKKCYFSFIVFFFLIKEIEIYSFHPDLVILLKFTMIDTRM